MKISTYTGQIKIFEVIFPLNFKGITHLSQDKVEQAKERCSALLYASV